MLLRSCLFFLKYFRQWVARLESFLRRSRTQTRRLNTINTLNTNTKCAKALAWGTATRHNSIERRRSVVSDKFEYFVFFALFVFLLGRVLFVSLTSQRYWKSCGNPNVCSDEKRRENTTKPAAQRTTMWCPMTRTNDAKTATTTTTTKLTINTLYGVFEDID